MKSTGWEMLCQVVEAQTARRRSLSPPPGSYSVCVKAVSTSKPCELRTRLWETARKSATSQSPTTFSESLPKLRLCRPNIRRPVCPYSVVILSIAEEEAVDVTSPIGTNTANLSEVAASTVDALFDCESVLIGRIVP